MKKALTVRFVCLAQRGEMVSDLHASNIPEVKLFVRFCEHKDGDTLPVGRRLS